MLSPVCSLDKTLLAFALLHFVLQGQTCLLLQMLVGLVHLPPGLETTLEAAVELEEWPQKKRGVEGRTKRAWWQSKKRQGRLLGFLIVLFFHNLIIIFFVLVRFLPTQGQFYFIEVVLL